MPDVTMTWPERRARRSRIVATVLARPELTYEQVGKLFGVTDSTVCRMATPKLGRRRGTARDHSRTLRPGLGSSAGYRRTRASWLAMKRRCANPADPTFHSYGGRGIKVCDRWVRSFDNFLDDMGQRPPGTSIDRIDNDGDYSPDNCRWATPTEQGGNRRNNRFVTAFGTTLHLTGWARHPRAAGICAKTIADRLRAGMSTEAAISMPPFAAKRINVNAQRSELDMDPEQTTTTATTAEGFNVPGPLTDAAFLRLLADGLDADANEHVQTFGAGSFTARTAGYLRARATRCRTIADTLDCPAPLFKAQL